MGSQNPKCDGSLAGAELTLRPPRKKERLDCGNLPFLIPARHSIVDLERASETVFLNCCEQDTHHFILVDC
jgi:hypothetical protein